MDLFSCRNCIHNPAQGMTLGSGRGFCLQWRSPIQNPDRTTCKYLHRKDLPRFLVREATAEHEEEFAHCAGMADLETREQVAHVPYEEHQRAGLEPDLRAVASYLLLEEAAVGSRRSALFSLLAGLIEGGRSMMQACLVRRAIHPGPLPARWWEWALELVEEVDHEVVISSREPGDAEEARWEVLHARLSALQELGWHSAIEALKFPMQEKELRSAVAEQDWEGVRRALAGLKERWREELRARASEESLSRMPEPKTFLLTDKPVRVGEASVFRVEELH